MLPDLHSDKNETRLHRPQTEEKTHAIPDNALSYDSVQLILFS